MKLISKHCEFGQAEHHLIRDRIVAGIIDNQLRTRLLSTANLTLAQSIEKARMSETTKEQSATMGKTVTTTVAVDTIHTQQQHTQHRFKGKKSNHSNSQNQKGSNGSNKQHTNTNNSNSSGDKGKQKGKCTYCGTTHKPLNCPAYGKTCHKCKRKNHFSSVCVARTIACIETNNESDKSEMDVFTLDTINVNQIDTIINTNGPWIEKVMTQGR